MDDTKRTTRPTVYIPPDLYGVGVRPLAVLR